MKYLITLSLIALSLFSFEANACDIRAAGLTDEQKQELKVQCEKVKLQAQQQSSNKLSVETVKEMAAYGEFAKDIAKAVGILATELGLSIDKFLATDAGKLAAFLLIWKIFGAEIFSVVLGTILCITTFKIAVTLCNKIRTKDYNETVRKTWFGFSEKTVQVPQYSPIGDLSSGETETLWTICFVTAVLEIIFIIFLF